MALESGRQLGHYEIREQIGKGGMGEVYRAHDAKLGRDVAIKVIPAEFGQDEERLARLEREARTLAALNHPNIAAIHGLEESDDTRFLVLELVEGDTLADRLKGGAIPVEESLRLSLQIAEALEAAHEKGVIHRDLKPANIKITPDGRVKVLDFGLAKAFVGDQADVNLSNSPTLSMQATQAGIILGTAAYMSPEQARGRNVDKRADVWAFGVVLYEMLAGRQVFQAEDVSTVLARVLDRDPDFTELPARLNSRLTELLERCLQKDPGRRYHDISDLRLDLENVLADPKGVVVQAHAAPVPTQPSRLTWMAAVCFGVLVSGATVWILKPAPTTEPPPVSRWEHLLPEGRTLRSAGRPAVALSPDGTRFVYNGSGGLYLRQIGEVEERLIPGTESPLSSLAFSPDGEWLAYQQDLQLKKIAVVGGAAVTLADIGFNPAGLSWDLPETILYGAAEGVMSVSADGGQPELLVPTTEEFPAGPYPQLLPGGNAVLFNPGGGATGFGGQVGIYSLDSRELTILFPGDRPRYLSTGHIVYALDDVLFAIPFDVARLEVTGGPVPLVTGVQNGPPQYSVSDSGSLAYVPGGNARAVALTWIDRDGAVERVETVPPGNIQGPRLSPNGDRVLLTRDGDVWIYDIASGRQDRVTLDGMSVAPYAEWDPTGARIAYSSTRGGDQGNVWIEPSDGSDEPRQVTHEEGENVRVDLDSWSATGGTLAVHKHEPRENIYTIRLDEPDAMLEPFLVRPDFDDGGTVFSPDGRYVAYVSAETGQREIQIRPYPGPGGQTTASVGGGTMPVWVPGGELFYRSLGGDRMMSVSIDTEPELTIGPPNLVFQTPPAEMLIISPRANYDVTEDGQRFLMLAAETGSNQQVKISVVLGWTQELRERVPVN